MTLFKTLTALCAGFAVTTAPALARVDAGTPALLRALPRHGVKVALNHSDCNGDRSFDGYYNTGTKAFVVCYSGTPDANDHDTVRHEAIHVAQNCAARRDGNPNGIRPLLRGTALNNFVKSVLSDEHIIRIKSLYPRDRHLTELEAFAAARYYTAAQVQQIVRTWCDL